MLNPENSRNFSNGHEESGADPFQEQLKIYHERLNRAWAYREVDLDRIFMRREEWSTDENIRPDDQESLQEKLEEESFAIRHVLHEATDDIIGTLRQSKDFERFIPEEDRQIWEKAKQIITSSGIIYVGVDEVITKASERGKNVMQVVKNGLIMDRALDETYKILPYSYAFDSLFKMASDEMVGRAMRSAFDSMIFYITQEKAHRGILYNGVWDLLPAASETGKKSILLALDLEVSKRLLKEKSSAFVNPHVLNAIVKLASTKELRDLFRKIYDIKPPNQKKDDSWDEARFYGESFTKAYEQRRASEQQNSNRDDKKKKTDSSNTGNQSAPPRNEREAPKKPRQTADPDHITIVRERVRSLRTDGRSTKEIQRILRSELHPDVNHEPYALEAFKYIDHCLGLAKRPARY